MIHVFTLEAEPITLAKLHICFSLPCLWSGHQVAGCKLKLAREHFISGADVDSVASIPSQLGQASAGVPWWRFWGTNALNKSASTSRIRVCFASKTERGRLHPFCVGAYRRQIQTYSSQHRSVYPNSQRHHEWVKSSVLLRLPAREGRICTGALWFHFCGVFYAEPIELNLNRSCYQRKHGLPYAHIMSRVICVTSGSID